MDYRETAEALSEIKSKAQEILERWQDDHPEAVGSANLERAVGLLGECESEFDRVADEHGERA